MLIIAISFVLALLVAWGIGKSTINQEKIMSQLSDLAASLTALTTKLQAIDTAVQALVAASKNPNVTLDAPTQAALDALTAEVGTVSKDAGLS